MNMLFFVTYHLFLLLNGGEIVISMFSIHWRRKIFSKEALVATKARCCDRRQYIHSKQEFCFRYEDEQFRYSNELRNAQVWMSATCVKFLVYLKVFELYTNKSTMVKYTKVENSEFWFSS